MSLWMVADTAAVCKHDPELSAPRPRVFVYQDNGPHVTGPYNWEVLLATKRGLYYSLANFGDQETAIIYAAGWTTGYMTAIKGEDAVMKEDGDEDEDDVLPPSA